MLSSPLKTALPQSSTAAIPVMRPRLPETAEILPYLQAIDERRWYSNGGPLVLQLEAEFSRRLGPESVGVVTTASGTAGLTAALLAFGIPAGSLCVMPSWTSAATPHAARAAGLKPWFHDVDRHTWALDPAAVERTLPKMTSPVGAVVAVSPFGAPLDVAAWEAFESRTGVRVAIDAAAGFDTLRASRLPTVVSLHATKILGAGEGGFVVTTDAALCERVRTCGNFGFQGTRSANVPALNAKMSEYHAAVALASLASWPWTRARHARVVAWYRALLERREGVALQPGYGTGWVSGTTNIELPARSAEAVAERLLELGVETRAWWGPGCHAQPAFVDCPRGPLPATEDLGGCVLGLPHSPDLRQRDIEAVTAALLRVLPQRAALLRRA